MTMDNEFEKLKQEIEADLGRPIDQGEEITIKALYGFGKGVKLKNQLESEPCHIKEILPGAMQEIKRRMKRQRRKRVIEAVGDFMSSKVGRSKKSFAKQMARKQKELFRQ